MKNMKKMFALMLAVLMLLSVCAVAGAEGGASTATTYTITAPANNHTYEVYQIFTGELTTNEQDLSVLSNVMWGKNGIKSEGTQVEKEVLIALKNVNGSDAHTKLDKIQKYVDLSSAAYGTVSNGSPLENVPAGYYLIKDIDDAWNDTHDAYTLFVVEVVDDVTMVAKSAKPTVDKQVWDEPADSENHVEDGWGETADHAINEVFQFKLTAELAEDEDYAYYKKYKIVFNDTLSSEVEFDGIVSVKINGKDVSDMNYRFEGTDDGGDWTLTIPDVLTAVDGVSLSTENTVVEVIYDAHLKQNAHISNVGDATLTDMNKNTVNLTYSNNPNWTGSGEYDGNMGKTPDDSVWVFTYDVSYEKRGESGEALPGAGFTLFDGENAIKLVLIGTDENSGVAEYCVAAATALENETVTEIITNEAGKFKIIGLDAGKYTLKETKTPEGYNTYPEVEVTIGATHTENAEQTDATVELDEDNTDLIIINNAGATLPETGGIGTTIFYVAGGVLVLLAVVLLVTKRRMGENN